MKHDTSEEVLNRLCGKTIESWSIGDDGFHFHLDDGRVAIVSGVFWIAIMDPDDEVVH